MNVNTGNVFRQAADRPIINCMNDYYLKLKQDGDVYYLFLIG